MAIHPADAPLRLNVGCGKRVLEGWLNVDIKRDPGAPREPELLCDIVEGIPLPSGCAAVVQAIHLVEHFPRWRVEGVLRDWHRLLVPGGTLIVELPDLVKCCQNYLERRTRPGKDPDQLSRWGIYGDPTLRDPFMLHMWGYAQDELMDLMIGSGFKSARHEETRFHPIGRRHRDMRIEATK